MAAPGSRFPAGNALHGYHSPSDSDSASDDDSTPSPPGSRSRTMLVSPIRSSPIVPGAPPGASSAFPVNSPSSANRNASVLGVQPTATAPDKAKLASPPQSPHRKRSKRSRLATPEKGSGERRKHHHKDKPDEDQTLNISGADLSDLALLTSSTAAQKKPEAAAAGPAVATSSTSTSDAPDRSPYVDALTGEVCYKLLPESGKIVVLNTMLEVKKAFQALVENNVRSAPLWDSKEKRYVGLITVSDFIDILRHFYQSPFTGMQELETQCLQTWRELAKPRVQSIISIGPEETMYAACKVLMKHSIHRLPVMDPETGTILAILSHANILDHLYETVKTRPAWFQRTIADLHIGTFRGVITVTMETPVIVVLNCFAERRVSAVPVVDETGVVVNVYSKSDVYELARQRMYDNLDVSVEVALQYRKDAGQRIHTCSKSDTLEMVLEKLLTTRVHRLICVDGTKRVEGIVSVGDVLAFFTQL